MRRKSPAAPVDTRIPVVQAFVALGMATARHLAVRVAASFIVTAVFTSSAAGQTPQIPTSPVWRSNDAFSSVDVAWVDFDGDGDLDLAFCNAPPGPTIAIYRND